MKCRSLGIRPTRHLLVVSEPSQKLFWLEQNRSHGTPSDPARLRCWLAGPMSHMHDRDPSGTGSKRTGSLTSRVRSNSGLASGTGSKRTGSLTNPPMSALFQPMHPMAQARGCAQPYALRHTFRISTSRFGTGQVLNSNQTPLGLHRIAAKIGSGHLGGTVFVGRRAVGLTWQGWPEASIAHRILWLEGLEPGFNRGANVDSFRRYIYIHGLSNEPTLGRPASRGCIHMAAADLIPLFDRVSVGTLVWIRKW